MKKVKKVIFELWFPDRAGRRLVGYRFFKHLPQRQEQVATTKVRKGDVVIRAYSRGELRAVRSVTLTAPNLFSTVQVTRLAPLGALAKEKRSDRRVRRFRAPHGARRGPARSGADRRADQEGQGRSVHPRQPGPGGSAEGPLLGAPRRARSAAQSDPVGHRRQEEPAEPGGGAQAALATGKRHQVAAGAGHRPTWPCFRRSATRA